MRKTIKVILMTLSFCCLTATLYSQSISLKMSDVAVKDAIMLLQEKTGYSFVYEVKDIDTQLKISIKAKESTIDEVVKQIIAGQKVSYVIQGKNIILTRKLTSTNLPSENTEIIKKKITGVVYDDMGEPVIGASVSIKNKTIGSITNIYGQFELPDVSLNDILQVSFIGMETNQMTVSSFSPIKVTLTQSSHVLEEVVAVGYGSMKKSDLTGSVATIKVDPLQAAQINSVDKLLSGRTAGIEVISGSGAPGAAINVKIRGTGTLSGNTQPLYVVDGIMINTSDQEVRSGITNGNYSQESQNGLTAINPQDIESIEVLKDASATAIYGSRGANGVVLITTKKGKTPKARIVFTTNTDVAQVSKKLPVLNNSDFALYYNELCKSLSLPLKYSTTSTGLDSLVTVDWQDYALRTSVSSNYRLSVSGKNDNTNYFIAGGFSNYEGVIKNTWQKKGDLRINVIQDINPKLKLTSNTGINFLGSNWSQGTTRIGNANSSIVRSMLSKNPIIGMFENDPMQDENLGFQSPRTFFEEFEDKSKEFRVISSLNIDYNLSKYLSYRLSVGGDYRNKIRQQFQGPGLYIGSLSNGICSWSGLEYYAFTIDNLLNFNFNIDRNNKFSGTIGCTYDSNINQVSTMTSTDFITDVLKSDGINLGNTLVPGVLTKSQVSIASALFRINYNLKEKYLLTFTGRTDGSSKFTEKERFGFFPSAALAWRVNQEKFLKRVNELSNLKIRAGWGQTGVQSIGAYQTKALYANQQMPNAGDVLSVGLTPVRIPNEMLTWETSNQLNVGLDMGMWNNRFSFTIDAYDKKSVDLLQNFPVAPSSGFTTMALNFGSIQNRGIEVSVDGIIIDNKFKWSVGGNITINRNKLVSLGLPVTSWGNMNMSAYAGQGISTGYLQSPANIFAEGYPVGMFWGLKTAGIYQTGDTEDQTYNGKKVVPGDVKFVDLDGNKIIDSRDYTFIGNPNPDFTYGFNTKFSYQGVKLEMLFNGVQGRDICNANLIYEEYTGASLGNNIRKDTWVNAWRPDAQSTSYPRIGYPTPSSLTDRLIEDGSYLRLANVTLSYEVPISKKVFNNLSVFISGSNLLLITKYKGFDPEVSSYTFDNTRIGIDWNSYPATKSISAGLNVVF
jgi:TonB-dependent starch-binding outer membrane protein SusC